MKPAIVLMSIVVGFACGREDPTGSTEPAGPVAVPITPASAVTHSVVVDKPGNVGQFTSLVSSPSGRQHIAYYDMTNADLKYATCPANCTVAGNWSNGPVDQTGAVGIANSLKVGSDGRRFVTYEDATHEDLKYATCAPAANCTVAANWVKTRIDTAGVVGDHNSLALGPDGSLNVSYRAQRKGSTFDPLMYATCRSRCTNTISWTKRVIDLPTGVAAHISLAVGSNGRRHISYYDDDKHDLKYATCAANCTVATNWQKVAVDQTGDVGLYTSLKVGSDGVVHISYHDQTHGDLKYARCAANCTGAASWKKVAVRTSGDIGQYTSLAVGARGRVYVSYFSFSGTALLYVTCAANCTQAASWTGALLDGARSLFDGEYNSLALAGNQVHVSYYDESDGNETIGALKYLEHTP